MTTRAGTSPVPRLLLGLSLVTLAALGVASRDIGLHWDEASITRSVRASFETGLLLPRWYNYPSLTYDVALLAALPRALADASAHFDPADGAIASPALLAHLDGQDYLLAVRAVFYVLCTLTGLAAFLTVRRLTGDEWPALFAALAAVAAWEFVYHARWVAPDGLVLVCAAFSLWAQGRILEPGDRGRGAWIAIAALFAGLGASAKYPGGILLVTLLVAIALAPAAPGRRRRDGLREAGLALGVALAAFAATSPGCLLEPGRFARGVVGEMMHYQFGHGGHTVASGWPHFVKIAEYLGLVFLSEQPVLAAAGAGLALLGAVTLARTRRSVAIWLLSLPVLFVAYLSLQRVMLVRNLLILLFPMAVLAGIGIAELWRRAAGRRPARLGVAALAAIFTLYNVGVAARSAWSVVSPNPVTQKQALERRLATAPATRFHLSPESRALLEREPAFRPANVVGTMDSADRFVFLSSEVQDWTQFAANRRGRYRSLWKRMDEVNWDYYPDWVGAPRMLEVSARALRVR